MTTQRDVDTKSHDFIGINKASMLEANIENKYYVDSKQRYLKNHERTC